MLGKGTGDDGRDGGQSRVEVDFRVALFNGAQSRQTVAMWLAEVGFEWKVGARGQVKTYELDSLRVSLSRQSSGNVEHHGLHDAHSCDEKNRGKG